YINQYSEEFLSDFIKLLRTAHGEKPVHINHFYQEYISNKEHIHMNATKWSSLTEFAKYLGREGICRVEEGEKGLFISWIDNSPEALRRQDAIRKKERMDRGDEEREKRMIEEQIRRARRDKGESEEREVNQEEEEKRRMLQRAEGEKIKLNLSLKPAASNAPSQPTSRPESTEPAATTTTTITPTTTTTTKTTSAPAPAPAPLKFSTTAAAPPKPKNVFAAAGAKKKKVAPAAASGPSSAMEKVIKEDMERNKRKGGAGIGFNLGAKKPRVA
ncbi:hypothetical protein KEM55_003986, partial [Ascosphaera atra]